MIEASLKIEMNDNKVKCGPCDRSETDKLQRSQVRCFWSHVGTSGRVGKNRDDAVPPVDSRVSTVGGT